MNARSYTAPFVIEGPLTNQATRRCPRDALDPIGRMKPLPESFAASSGRVQEEVYLLVRKKVTCCSASSDNTSPPHCLNTRVAWLRLSVPAVPRAVWTGSGQQQALLLGGAPAPFLQTLTS